MLITNYKSIIHTFYCYNHMYIHIKTIWDCFLLSFLTSGTIFWSVIIDCVNMGYPWSSFSVHMILLQSRWASCLMFLTILNTSASSILNSKLQLGPREVEFAVLAENQEAVIEFCQGGGCTYVGQVSYMEVICKQFTKMKL